MNSINSTYQLIKNQAIASFYLMVLCLFARDLMAAETTPHKDISEISHENIQAPDSNKTFIIEPNIKNKAQAEPDFNTIFVHITPFIGGYKLDGFGMESQTGVKLGLHLHRRIFIELQYGLSEIDESFRTDLGFLPLIENNEFDYYDLSLGYNALISKLHCKPCGNRTINTDIYLMAGFGNINIETTPENDINDKIISLEIGLRAALIKHLFLNASIKNQTMKENLLDNTSSAHNLSYNLGLGIYY